VLVLDFDVHHGNGTNDIFYDDPSVLFISSHQNGIYPQTGRITDAGTGDGAGATINLPLPGTVPVVFTERTKDCAFYCGGQVSLYESQEIVFGL
jgi:acetoin utilization deacetylase AcuC-like enzyme